MPKYDPYLILIEKIRSAANIGLRPQPRNSSDSAIVKSLSAPRQSIGMKEEEPKEKPIRQPMHLNESKEPSAPLNPKLEGAKSIHESGNTIAVEPTNMVFVESDTSAVVSYALVEQNVSNEKKEHSNNALSQAVVPLNSQLLHHEQQEEEEEGEKIASLV